jgi:hypothetical protein
VHVILRDFYMQLLIMKVHLDVRILRDFSKKNSHVADNRSTPMRNLFVQFHSNRASTKSLTPMTRKHIQVHTFIRFKYRYINFTAFIQSNHVLDNLLSHHLV